jgi:gliding motility-associated-like protein
MGLTETTYTVKNTDIHSCDYTGSVKVGIHPYPVFRAASNTAICYGDAAPLWASGGDHYQWLPADMLDNPGINKPVSNPSVTTQYSVYIRDNTCLFDTTINMAVKVNPLPEITAQKANDINCNIPSTQLIATGGLRYTWSPSTGLDDPHKPNPVSITDSTTKYFVEGVNQFGCTAGAYVTVAVTKDGTPRFVVPNAFTPNGDGNNDCFGIKRWGNAKVEEFAVYNRWGQLIFKTTNPNRCWDGTFNGKPQDTGGYVYVIKAQTLCGVVNRRGIVMLIR